MNERRREDHPSEDSGVDVKTQVPLVAIGLPERHRGEESSPRKCARASAAGDEFENALNLCMSHMAG